jgi:hypothetical protein
MESKRMVWLPVYLHSTTSSIWLRLPGYTVNKSRKMPTRCTVIPNMLRKLLQQNVGHCCLERRHRKQHPGQTAKGPSINTLPIHNHGHQQPVPIYHHSAKALANYYIRVGMPDIFRA